MAASNSVSWLSPDPIRPSSRPSINRSSYIGEIQHRYKNYFKDVWVHPSALVHFSANDPKRRFL